MQDASAPQRQARLVAGTKRIAILLFNIHFTNPPERRLLSAIAVYYRHRFTFLLRPLLSWMRWQVSSPSSLGVGAAKEERLPSHAPADG
jgi:hypothetical protein